MIRCVYIYIYKSSGNVHLWDASKFSYGVIIHCHRIQSSPTFPPEFLQLCPLSWRVMGRINFHPSSCCHPPVSWWSPQECGPIRWQSDVASVFQVWDSGDDDPQRGEVHRLVLAQNLSRISATWRLCSWSWRFGSMKGWQSFSYEICFVSCYHLWSLWLLPPVNFQKTPFETPTNPPFFGASTSAENMVPTLWNSCWDHDVIMVVEPTHLKNMIAKLDHFPRKVGVNMKKNLRNATT